MVIEDDCRRYVGLPSRMAIPANPDRYPGMAYANGGTWWDSDDNGIPDPGRAVDGIFGAGTWQQTTTTVTQTISDAADIVVTGLRIIGDVFNPRTTSDRALLASARTDASNNRRPQALVRNRPATGSSWTISMPSFEWPSEKWDRMASTRPSWDAGIQARLNGADPMGVAMAHREGTQNFIAKGFGELTFGLWETNFGFVSTAAAPPSVVLTERSSSPYVKAGGRGGFVNSPWFGMAAEAYLAAKVAPLAARGAAAESEVLTVTRTTRSGETAIRQTRPDGSVIDISPQRVKEFVPNMNPNAPAGTLQRVKFPDPLPGSKGFKRTPTPAELELLRNAR
jgi:hypothetical protein